MQSIVRVGIFSPSPVLEVLARHGLAEAAGLRLEIDRVASSIAQFEDLRRGRYDLVLTSPDNVLAYRFDEANPLGATMDVRILAGVDRGLGLSLLAAPGIATPAALAGRRIGVDTPESGFALALLALLEAEGLEAGTDYELVELGGTPRRLEQLLAGACDATMLNAGFDLRAEAAGCRRLVRVGYALAPYLATVLATTGDRLEAAREPLRRFLTAWLAALERARHPSEAGPLSRFAAAELGLGPTEARRYVAILTDDREGLVPGGAVDPAALLTLVQLRRRRAARLLARADARADAPSPRLLERSVLADPGLVETL